MSRGMRRSRVASHGSKVKVVDKERLDTGDLRLMGQGQASSIQAPVYQASGMGWARFRVSQSVYVVQMSKDAVMRWRIWNTWGRPP